MNATKRAHFALMSEAIRLEALDPGWGFSWAMQVRESIFDDDDQLFKNFDDEAYRVEQSGYQNHDPDTMELGDQMGNVCQRALEFFWALGREE